MNEIYTVLTLENIEIGIATSLESAVKLVHAQPPANYKVIFPDGSTNHIDSYWWNCITSEAPNGRRIEVSYAETVPGYFFKFRNKKGEITEFKLSEEAAELLYCMQGQMIAERKGKI